MNDNLLKTVEKGIFEKGQRVSGVVESFTPLGINFIIEGKYLALAYKEEIFTTPKKGDKMDVYVKEVRGDGKIDIILQQPNFRVSLSSACDKIISKLNEAGGTLPYGDKSAPEEIYAVFGMSKNLFKQAIGVLYKNRKVILSERNIKLV